MTGFERESHGVRNDQYAICVNNLFRLRVLTLHTEKLEKKMFYNIEPTSVQKLNPFEKRV